MIGATHLIVVAPHPDDETIALGGTIHDHLRRGGSCQIVAVTEGEAADSQASPEERAALALRRAAERAAALETVGAGAAGVDRLRYPDREVHAHLRTLERELAELFTDALRGRESCLVVLPWREDPHDDHRACASAGVRAAIHAGVPYVETPIWGWYDDQARRPASLRSYVAAPHQRRGGRPEARRAPLLPEPVRAPPGKPRACSSGGLLQRVRHRLRGAAPMSVGAAFFDAMYARSDDPWGFTTRWYEARKYALTLAALPRARYRRVFEPGCAIGALTGRLAERADSVVAMDVSAGALAQARRAAFRPTSSWSRVRFPTTGPTATSI